METCFQNLAITSRTVVHGDYHQCERLSEVFICCVDFAVAYKPDMDTIYLFMELVGLV